MATKEEIKEGLFRILSNPPCSKCNNWHCEQYFCFNTTTDECEFIDQIISCLHSQGVVIRVEPSMAFGALNSDSEPYAEIAVVESLIEEANGKAI